jgi:signal transduction histidine kinase
MSFRTKIILNINILLFVFMMSLAWILVHLRARELRANIEKNAKIVASLTVGSLCEAYDNYYEAGYYKFRQRVLSLLSIDKELERVAIFTVDGKKVFDSDEFKGKGVDPLEVSEQEKLDDRIKKVNPSFSYTGKAYYDVVYPYLEPWGWHRYSVRYYFTTEYLEKRLTVLRFVIFSVTFVAVLLASIISHFQAQAVTKPLDTLTEAAKEITAGNFDADIELAREDEVGILANALQEMVHRVKRDVAMLEKQKQSLSEANIELKKLNELKSQFLASVSHELMTPLTSLKGYIDYLYQEKLGPLNEGQKRGLEVAQRNLERLNKQILNLIDFSSFESGKFELSLTPFHIKGAVQEAVTNLDAKLTEKEIKYEEVIPESIPPVIADRERIIQILENLITNAVKFTHPGGSISIDCLKLNGADTGKIEVCVSDSGVGISHGMKKKVFDKFFQIDPKGEYKGLGLGLSIVKSIVDAHHEKVTVESKKGRGSRFCFTLPIYGGGEE